MTKIEQNTVICPFVLILRVGPTNLFEQALTFVKPALETTLIVLLNLVKI